MGIFKEQVSRRKQVSHVLPGASSMFRGFFFINYVRLLLFFLLRSSFSPHLPDSVVLSALLYVLSVVSLVSIH